jgi:shikimate kinase
MNPAPNLVLVGPMGAGKSSLGKRLAARLGLQAVDVDSRLEQLAGVAVPVIFELEGESGFRAREAQLLAELMQGRDQVVATGGGAVLAPATRELLRRHGFVVYVRVGIGQQLQRLARDHGRPLLAGGDRRATLEALAALRNPLYEQVADLVFDTDGMSLASAANKLGAQVQAQWRREETA